MLDKITSWGKKILYGIFWVLKKYVSVYPFLYKKLGWWGILLDVVIFFATICIIGGALDALFFSKEEKEIRKAGEKFEDKVAKRMESALGVPIHRSVLLPDGNGGTTEVDLVAVTKKAVVFVECKERPYEYQTFGSLYDDRDWQIQDKNGLIKSTLKSPYIQNKGHIKAFHNKLESDMRTLNVVAMGTHSIWMRDPEWNRPQIYEYNKIDQIGAYVYSRGQEKLFAKALEKYPDYFTDEQVNILNSFFDTYEATPEQMKRHREYVMSIHGYAGDR